MKYIAAVKGISASLVTSVFGRSGSIVAQLNDYASSLIDNDSGVSGATVKDALDNLEASLPAFPVTSTFGRIGAVVAVLNDYAAGLVDNDSGVSGATVKDALNSLLAAIPTVPVSSVFGRTGTVVAALNDYAASLIRNDSRIGHTTVKSSLDTLLTLTVGEWVYRQSSGVGAAPASLAQQYIPRKNDQFSLATLANSEFPIGTAGTFTFTVTWRVSGTKLVTDSVTLEVFKNGVASGVSGVIPPATTSGQFSGSITCAVGDGIAIGALQNGVEAQVNWLLNVSVKAK